MNLIQIDATKSYISNLVDRYERCGDAQCKLLLEKYGVDFNEIPEPKIMFNKINRRGVLKSTFLKNNLTTVQECDNL